MLRDRKAPTCPRAYDQPLVHGYRPRQTSNGNFLWVPTRTNATHLRRGPQQRFVCWIVSKMSKIGEIWLHSTFCKEKKKVWVWENEKAKEKVMVVIRFTSEASTILIVGCSLLLWTPFCASCALYEHSQYLEAATYSPIVAWTYFCSDSNNWS